jgi:hypothetical protein
MALLTKLFEELEHAPIEERRHALPSLFVAQRMLSNFIWDIYSHNTALYYQLQNPDLAPSELNKKGVYTSQLDADKTKLLLEIFESCENEKFAMNTFPSGYFYEPRQSIHEDMVRINDYYKPSEKFYKDFPEILNPLTKLIEQQCGCYFRIGSLRIFSLKPVNKTQGMHLDGWPFAIRKVFFYPNGVGMKFGSTEIKTKKGEAVIIEGEKGTWAIFENSLVAHQAFSTINSERRPTIELDIVPAYKTDTTLNFVGTNGWYPWWPLEASEVKIHTPEFNYEAVYERTLQRVLGFASLLKSESFFENDDLSNFNHPESWLNMDLDLIKSQSSNNAGQLGFRVSFQQMVDKYGIKKILQQSIKHIIKENILRKK